MRTDYGKSKGEIGQNGWQNMLGVEVSAVCPSIAVHRPHFGKDSANSQWWVHDAPNSACSVHVVSHECYTDKPRQSDAVDSIDGGELALHSQRYHYDNAINLSSGLRLQGPSSIRLPGEMRCRSRRGAERIKYS